MRGVRKKRSLQAHWRLLQDKGGKAEHLLYMYNQPDMSAKSECSLVTDPLQSHQRTSKIIGENRKIFSAER